MKINKQKLKSVISDFARIGIKVYQRTNDRFSVWFPGQKNNSSSYNYTQRELYRLHRSYFNGNDKPHQIVKQDKKTNRRKEKQIIKEEKFDNFEKNRPIFRDDVWFHD